MSGDKIECKDQGIDATAHDIVLLSTILGRMQVSQSPLCSDNARTSSWYVHIISSSLVAATITSSVRDVVRQLLQLAEYLLWMIKSLEDTNSDVLVCSRFHGQA